MKNGAMTSRAGEQARESAVPWEPAPAGRATGARAGVPAFENSVLMEAVPLPGVQGGDRRVAGWGPRPRRGRNGGGTGPAAQDRSSSVDGDLDPRFAARPCAPRCQAVEAWTRR